MFKIDILISCLYFVSLTPFLTNGMTAEQNAAIHQRFEELGMECMKDYPISTEDIADLKASKLASGENVPCFLSCIEKKVGIIDENGMMQKETALERAKAVFNDEEELKLIGEYLHSCSHVNKEPVTDGEKGCQRAVLAYKCMKENAAQFGFDV